MASKEMEALKRQVETKVAEMKIDKSHNDLQLMKLAFGHLLLAAALVTELNNRHRCPLVVKDDLMFATIHMAIMSDEEERRPKEHKTAGDRRFKNRSKTPTDDIPLS